MLEKWEAEQKEICARFGSRFVPIPDNCRIGIALATMSLNPVHGLRHLQHGNMVGWYVWSGAYSEDPNFFDVLHARHFASEYPHLVRFFALEPGFRFLTDGDHIDVWFDPQLLQI